ncbi:OmpA family protein [Paraburkholderia sediminicola]
MSRISYALLTSISVAALLGACTSASGPKYNLYTEKLSDGTNQYRVECGGLLETSATCRAVAERTCGNQPVSVVMGRDGWRGPSSDKSDPRLLVFRCGAAPAPAARTEEGTTKVIENFTLDSNALFAYGKSSLDSMLHTGRAQLDEAIERIKSHKEVTRILVVGHTDRIGNNEENGPLSVARANTVRGYLISHGLDGNLIQAEGVGSSEPVSHCPEGYSSAVIACLQPDRRVSITASGHS